MPTGEWTHLAVTLGGGTGRLYVNGELAEEKTGLQLNPSMMGHTRNNWIGASQFTFDPLIHGRVDEFQIFDHALDAAEVKALSASADGTSGGGNVAWYRFDEDGGATVNDSSGAGRHGQVIAHASAWQPVADAGASLIAELDDAHPLNDMLTRSMRLDITALSPGQRAGLANSGYFGVPAVAGQTCRVSFWAKAAEALAGPLTVGIESSDGNRSIVSAEVSGISTGWQQFHTTLEIPSGAGDSADNRFVIGLDRRHESSGEPADATIWLQVVSVFPPTYKNRENGLRAELVEHLRALKPRFFRFPGGTYVLGHTVDTRFKWKESLGSISQRPGHDNDVWRYWSDDGLGLLEYLLLAEDLEATPVVGVYPGLSGGRPVPQDELAPFVQDALDLIEYMIGPVTSEWGARRAEDGHPEPFETPIVEIGNEDFLGIGNTYTEYRYPMFYDAIKASYPQVKTIATMPVPDHPCEIRDEHMYRAPDVLIARAEEFDSYDRNGPQIFVGEWSVITGVGNNATANLGAAVAEAAFMTVLERNSDVVAMQCYAPLFAFDGQTQWNPDLIGFDHLGSYVSPSYWAQHMFGLNIGDKYLPVDVSAEGLYCSATLDSKTSRVFLKIANIADAARSLTINIGGSDASEATILVLTGDPESRNGLDNPHRVAPSTGTLHGADGTFEYEAPACSATVVVL